MQSKWTGMGRASMWALGMTLVCSAAQADAVAVGFIHENQYWLVRYLAPKLHYAQRDQATFDGFLKDLKLKPKCRIFCSD